MLRVILKKLPHKNSIVILLLLLSCFVVYVHNLSRGVMGGDVGDFVSAASVMGVPHAPGYPLFTFIGFLLTRINFMTPAFMVGLISVVSSCLSVAFFYYMSFLLTKNRFIALISALILAFNYLFWFYSEIAEVFALNTLFVIILFLLSFLYYKTDKNKILYLLAFFTGLALTNHQTIILIFPSILILILGNLLKHVKKPKTIFTAIFFFLIGLSPYLYVPIASFFNPPVNWDNVKDISSFLHLLLRQDYGTFNAGPTGEINSLQRFLILKNYLSDLLVQLTVPVILISLLGFFESIKKEKKLFVSLLITFLLCGPLFVVYAGFPLESNFYLGVYERFFITSSVILLFFFPYGLQFFVNFLNKLMRKTIFSNIFIGIFLIIPISLFYYNFPKTDLHNIYIGDRLAYDLLSPLPHNSVFLVSGDTTVFNILYAKYSLKFRPDIQIVNINTLGADSYIKSRQAEYLINNPEDKTSKDLFVHVIKYISKNRQVFSLVELQPKTGEKNVWIPYGLVFKLYQSLNDTPLENKYLTQTGEILSKFKKPGILELQSIASGSLSIADIPVIYSTAYLRIGNFIYSQYNDKNLAYAFIKRAIDYDPNLYQNYDVLGAYYLDAEKDCNKAAQSFYKALSIYPIDNYSYYLLYLTYRDCFKDKKMANKIVSEYNDKFKSDFFSDVGKNKAALNK